MQPLRILSAPLALACLLLSPLAHSATVEAFATIATSTSPVPPNSPPTLQANDPGPASANAIITDSRNEAEGQGVGDVGGQLAASASFFGAQGRYAEVRAGANWTENWNAAAGSSATFDFFIPGAAIGFQASNVCCLVGGYNISILLNGSSVFSAVGQLDQIPEPGGFNNFPRDPEDVNLTQSGTILDATFTNGIAEWFSNPGNGAGYLFDSFSGSIALSPLAGNNELVYSMDVFVRGLIGETSAIASIGDPFALSQSGGTQGVPGVALALDGLPPPIPIPVAAWLFATGIVSLIGFARLRKSIELG